MMWQLLLVEIYFLEFGILDYFLLDENMKCLSYDVTLKYMFVICAIFPNKKVLPFHINISDHKRAEVLSFIQVFCLGKTFRIRAQLLRPSRDLLLKAWAMYKAYYMPPGIVINGSLCSLF